MSEPETTPEKNSPESGRANATPPQPERPSDDERPVGGASPDLPLSSPD